MKTSYDIKNNFTSELIKKFKTLINISYLKNNLK